MSLSWEMNQFKHIEQPYFNFPMQCISVSYKYTTKVLLCYGTRLTCHVEPADPYISCGSYAGKAKCSTLQRLGPTTEIKTFNS